MIQRIKAVLKGFTSLIVLCTGILTAGCFIPVCPDSVPETKESERISVWIADNGVHTSIIVPAQHRWFDWVKFLSLGELDDRAKSFEYLDFGWGDRTFYIETPRWSDLDVCTAFNAAVLSSESVVRVAGLFGKPQRAEMKRLRMSQNQYRSLTAHLKSSFARREDGFQPIDAGYGQHDFFFVSDHDYHLFNNCNSWTADALHRAGFTTPLLPLFSGSVMWHLPSTSEQ
jgi:uncharacterized protein (TIGR02117 family)